MTTGGGDPQTPPGLPGSSQGLPSWEAQYQSQPGTPQFNLMGAANNALLTGGPAMGALEELGPLAGGALGGAFGGGPFDPSLDPTAALQQMLSGEGQYGLVQDAVRAGAQPSLDILQEDILPALRSRTVGAQNPTGEIKDINRIVPRVMRDITNAGVGATLGEYNRAQTSRDRAAMQMQGSQDLFRNQALGLGGLQAQLLGQQSGDIRAGMAMMPQTIQTGMMPADFMQQYGQFQSGFEQASLQDELNRWNFAQNQPQEFSNWFANLLGGGLAAGGTQTSEMSGNPALGGAMGALGGSMIPGLLGPGGLGLMAANPAMWPFLIGGGLLGAFG